MGDVDRSPHRNLMRLHCKCGWDGTASVWWPALGGIRRRAWRFEMQCKPQMWNVKSFHYSANDEQ